MKASARIKEKRLGRFSPLDLPEQIRTAEIIEQKTALRYTKLAKTN